MVAAFNLLSALPQALPTLVLRRRPILAPRLCEPKMDFSRSTQWAMARGTYATRVGTSPIFRCTNHCDAKIYLMEKLSDIYILHSLVYAYSLCVCCVACLRICMALCGPTVALSALQYCQPCSRFMQLLLATPTTRSQIICTLACLSTLPSL